MLTHKGTKVIKTERLILRRFSVEDAQPMFDTWANDERVTRFLTWPPHGTPDVTKMLLGDWCSSYTDDNYYNWVIEIDGKVIGSISVVRLDENSEYAEIGYCLAYDFWKKGIMTEACKAVISFLFNEVGLNRIEITHAVKNPGSGRVAQKCGLTYEGTKREYFKAINGEFLDISCYSVLKREFL